MKRYCLLIFIAVASVACVKNNDPVPNVAVFVQASLQSPQYSALKGAGIAITIPGGVAGIIVYHRADGTYVAYDRCSSYKPENRCAVNIDSGDLTATDPCSGSKFSLYDGTPVKAPATVSLKEYSVTVDDAYDITISNY